MHERWFSGLVILAAAISIGCGGGSGTKPEVLAGELAVIPASLSFGMEAHGYGAVLATGSEPPQLSQFLAQMHDLAKAPLAGFSHLAG